MEIVELFDKDRKSLGKTIERSAEIPQNAYVLYMHGCIFNSKGEMLIQQRAKSIIHKPNIWDITFTGGVRASETTQEAAQRELFEELGLKYDFINERPFFTINDDKRFDDFYILEKDIDLSKIRFEDGKVQAVRWASEDEIINLIKNKKFIQYKPSFIKAIFSMRKQRGIYI